MLLCKQDSRIVGQTAGRDGSGFRLYIARFWKEVWINYCKCGELKGCLKGGDETSKSEGMWKSGA